MFRALFPALVFLAILVAGCGGGGGGSSTTPSTPAPGASAVIPVGPSGSVVTLAGSGYKLSFAMPGETNGSSATVTATLTTTLPNGVIAPAAHKTPKTIGATTTPLVYLTLTTTAQVGFSSRPTLTFTLPSASAIPAGDPSYIIYFDPAVGSWSNWLNGTLNGTTDTFLGALGGFSLKPGVLYVIALAYTPQAVPTAAPGATPSPTPAPAAAYCSAYSSNTSAGAVPLNITDDSGLGATLMVYVQNGNYMDNTGQFTQANPYPLPALCFSNTSGSSVVGKPLQIPQGAQGRVYFAYTNATPNPSASATPPNPFGAGGASFNPDYNDSPFPWDKIEYGIVANGVMDTTQVDFMGLPIEMSLATPLPHQAPSTTCAVSPSTVVGVTSCGFGAVFSAMSAPGVAAYNSLVITQMFNNQLIDMRVVAPKNALSFTSFQWNLFDLPASAPITSPCTTANTNTNGYLQCVLAYYQTTPRLFTSNVPGAGAVGSGTGNISGDWYCASSDGSANFIFTDVGSTAPTSCASAVANPSPRLAANPFKLPIATLTYGQPPAQDTGGNPACQYNNLFSQPYGLFFVDNQTGQGSAYTTSGNLFSGSDAFAMWKALVADLNYGTTLQSGKHPVGQFASKPLQVSSFWLDPMYNTYDNIMHANFDNNLAYGIAYDDLFGWSTSVTYATGNAINVRINAIPSASTKSAAPLPVGNPSPCPVIPPEIGTY